MSTGTVGMTILTGGAGQAAGSLVGPATEAGKGVYYFLKRKYEYIRNLDQNQENLETEARYLSSREKDVRNLIARNPMKEKTHECATWLEDVQRMTQSLNDLRNSYEKLNHGSCGPCQLHTRLTLSRKIVKLTQSVVNLRDQMNLDHKILIERHPEKVVKKFPKKINEAPSLHENVEKLLDLLKDESIQRIGIWGMSGVGKTTILENLNDEVAKLQIFDMVFWVTVSKEVSLHQIQEAILRRLNVKEESIDFENQAAALISKLLEDKKYLLLLDDVSREFDLHRVGIQDSHTQGKLVLATRERSICNLMETDEEIKVERLSRDDARRLFHVAVGEAVKHPTIKPIAERVLKQCGELPQIIRAVGSHLKGELSEDLWRNTLSKLQSPILYQSRHMEDVFTAIRLIYDKLEDNLKNCLLYGASYPEDHEIYQDYLIECWRTERLIGIGQTLRKAREEGYANLKDLVDKCLFDRCKSMKHVKIPIIFRNAAIRNAHHQNFGLLVRDDEELEVHPPVDHWRNARILSLINSDLTQLPERPECLRASSLLLQKNRNLTTIPESFFDSMPTLKILDLFGTGIKCLPSSISKLTSLSSLYLNDCHQLVHLPDEIGELQNLEILDISRSGICGVPTVIGELTCLRCLRISFTSVLSNHSHVEANSLEVIPSEIFEGLLKLEELAIDADPKDLKWKKYAPMIAAKLAYLGKLSALSFYFPNIESLNAFTQASISWKNFRTFSIFVGPLKTGYSSQANFSKCSGHRYLQYSGGRDTPNVIKEMLQRTFAFQLIGHQDVTSFSSFGTEGMECLETCVIEGCNTMETIIDSNAGGNCALPWLQELHLLKLQQLKHISKGLISPRSFARLTTLTISDCPRVTKVISWEMANQLIELQNLRVQNCPNVTEIIDTVTQSSVASLCPKLKLLELISLEGLVSIHCSDLSEWHALQEVEIFKCDNLVNLCLNTTNAPKLRSIRCTEAWWGSLMLTDDVKTHLLAFCCFIKEN